MRGRGQWSLARDAIVFETERAEEFSPVKNAEGVDSPATCHRDQIRRARKASGNWSTLPPQSEHVLLLGKKRPANTTCPPRMAALYSNCRRNSKKPMSAMEPARERLAGMPRTFRFSMPMV